MICKFDNFSAQVRFQDLVESVQNCDLCARLCGNRKVLSSANGSINSKVLFIAEAPGRLGADRTGIPLHGDRTGVNFETLLSNIGWNREELFITNAVLCNPRNENGNNGTPTPDEIANCSAYLEMVIEVVRPDVIVTLGVTALDALSLILPHSISLRQNVATPVPWRGSILFPLYHPGPRAIIHRSLPKQRADYMQLAKIVHPSKGLIEQKKSPAKTMSLPFLEANPAQQVIQSLLSLGGQMTLFKLTKLLYLIDLFSLEKLGQMCVSDLYLRQVDGPWSPRLKDILSSMQGYEVRQFSSRQVPMVAPGPSPRSEVQLSDAILNIITEVFHTYGSLSNSALKTAVYRTEPMKFILLEESQGKKMVNKPVLYKGKKVSDL